MHRRRFLRSSVGAGCVVVAFSACDREKADELADSGVANVDHADLAWAKAPCRYCGTGCGVEVGMHDGKETCYRYAAGHDPFVKKEKGVHFYKAKGYGEKAAVWIRPYHPPAEVPDDDYPLWLCTGRVLEHWHTGSMTRRVRELHQAVPEAYVEMNAQDAVALGMQDGQRARVVSRRGSVELLVRVEGRGRCPRGTVFVPFFDEKRLANILTLDAMDNISKEPDYKKCAVRLERV